ncbi:helix-turn-helix transcriptional regulator [Brevibacterium aurantiacum]|uniref:helix-turn-helix transcriptional regulator n=1 Tax=Brevibacterium aurantiacum TaxID=273384 RepID=UPI0000510304|nr:helix-turn-helix domain-containing protein [Brevibacterium aurantiacum]
MTTTSQENTRAILTNQDLADRLQMPEQTLAIWRMKGYGPRFFKAGRYVRYRLADVLAWELEQLEATA